MQWLALPKAERKPKTQRQFATELSVHETTLSDWKRLDGFTVEVTRLARAYMQDDVPEVLATIRREAKRGTPYHTNLFLSMTGLEGDLEAAGKGPGGVPVREVVVMLRTDEPLATE